MNMDIFYNDGQLCWSPVDFAGETTTIIGGLDHCLDGKIWLSSRATNWRVLVAQFVTEAAPGGSKALPPEQPMEGIR
jgi:hypothetical protein